MTLASQLPKFPCEQPPATRGTTLMKKCEQAGGWEKL